MHQTLRDKQLDVAIVGGGIACTHVLSTILDNARRSQAGLRIAVFEKDGEFWRGFPYGRRSSVNSLIITPLCEFVPAGERDSFIHWLRTHFETWRDTLVREGGVVGQTWLDVNEEAMKAGDWDEIYVPRWLYGDFIEERIERQIAEAVDAMDATVEKISACVEDIECCDPGYILQLDALPGRVKARTVVLTIGSPPCLKLAGSEDVSQSCLYVNNAYLPSLDENLERLKRELDASPAHERNLLIVGSNATSLELIYMISRSPDLRATVNKIVVLSRSGAFPHRMTRDRFKLKNFSRLQSLQTSTHVVTGPDILKATEADLRDLSAAGDAIGDYLDHLNKLLVILLGRMTPAAQHDFHVRYGMAFTRLVRRAGAEYRDPVDELAAAGKLDVIPASFERLSPANGGGARAAYTENGCSTASPLTFRAVVNCAGFENVSADSSSRLLANLIRKNLSSANETGRGLKVNERFAAGPGLFVCGPLLAGVFNEKAKFWHVENVRRIQSIAETMGLTILDSIQAHA